MTYKIEGMHCAACSAVIQMNLEDAGFEKAVVLQEQQQLEVPEEYNKIIEEIKKVVDSAGHYELVISN